MINIIKDPKRVPLRQFLLMLDLLNKEKKSLVYYTPQDIFGELKPGLDYTECIRTLNALDNFWTRNEQTNLYSIIQEEKSNGVLLSISIGFTNNKIEAFNHLQI
jgi:hypothetical protein